jgi:23S rRNA (cytosine1962-C5)-methyltransferase
VNAEGDGLPGVVIDAYGNTAVMQLRTPGTRALAHALADRLTQQLGFHHVFDKTVPNSEDEEAEGSNPNGTNGWLTKPAGEIQFLENGLKFYSAPDQGQKTGYYLDQRENRLKLKQLAKEREVLDAFTYAGGFGIYALAGGAKRVVSVDASENAVALCRRNVEANFPADARHQAALADCFDYLRQMPEGEFDCIVLDPPAFTKHISTVKKAARGYKDINLHALRKVRSGGLVFTFSCSQHISKDLFRKIVFGAAADARRSVRILDQLGQPLDHPVSIFHPEGEYLKGLILHVE